MKLILTHILFLLCFSTLASTVRLSATPAININNIYDPLNSVAGDGTSSSAPLKIYVPISAGAASDQVNNHALGASLFTEAAANLKITMDIVSDSAAVGKLKFYVKDSSTSYDLVATSTTSCGAGSTCSDQITTFSISSICNGNCTSFATTVEKISGYIALADDAFVDPVDPTGSAMGSGGIYVEIYVSGVVYDGSGSLDIAPTLTNVAVGDQRLTYTFTIPSNQTYFRDLTAFDITSSTGDKFNENVVNATLTTDDELTFSLSGYFDLRKLENDRIYKVKLAVRDKFGFYTKLSNELEGTPLSIAEFLEKNQCYLISAGFMEQHYVLDYFRHIRDDYLMSFSLGEAFIEMYYATAPKYVPYIISHPAVQGLIRIAAYCLYFLMNFGAYIIGIFLLLKFVKLKLSKSIILK